MRSLFLVLFLLYCRLASAQVILTEVMFNPRGNENAYEFIEIYNTSLTDSVLLAGWKIGDQTETDALVSPDSLYWLAPQQFAVVLDPNYFQNPAVYDSLIPAAALILTINDNSFGSGGLSNSTAETIVLLDAADKTVTRYTYSLGNADGFSDEKIFLTADDTPSNWANSRRIDGTPGARNSASPYRVDGELRAQSFFILPQTVRAGQSAKLSVTLQNAGLQSIGSATVEFFITQSNAALNLPLQLGAANLTRALSPTDSLRISLEWPQSLAGRHELAAILHLPNDENARNDTLHTTLSVGYQRHLVRINEILFAPKPEQPEWIEIYNLQTTRLSLSGWTLEDESGTRAAVPKNIAIPPQSYRVIAAHSSVAGFFQIPDSLAVTLAPFPTLNNSGDILLLRDFSGAVIDSVAYQMSWGAAGVSAEKIWHERNDLTENWQPSQDPRGGTPAALNSVSPRDIDLAMVRLQFDPARPRAGNDVDLVATIRNSGRSAIHRSIVTFADDHNHDGQIQSGEEIGKTAFEQVLSPEDTATIRQRWVQPLSGKHAVLAVVATPLDAVPANDRFTGRLSVGYDSRRVVINEIYYAPRSGEIEWVELLNRSNQSVDLSAWQWRDAGADFPLVFPDSTLILAPNELVLLAPNSNIPNADPQARKIIAKNWLTLNNDHEQLVLSDFHDRRQDSLAFSQDWGGDTGVSLERINPNLSSTDSTNWSSCVDPTGSTPGRRNSIFTEFIPQQATITASPQPFSPDGDGHDDFVIIQLQVPATTAAAHLKVYDLRGRLVHQLLNNAPVGASYQISWSGRDHTNQLLPMGVYILYLQAIQATGGILVEARTTLVLARKLN